MVATLGNTLGGMTNYGLGWCLPSRLDKESQANKAQNVGINTATGRFFSWLPVIGDPLCLAAGWLRMRFWQCLGIIFIGKVFKIQLAGCHILWIFLRECYEKSSAWYYCFIVFIWLFVE